MTADQRKQDGEPRYVNIYRDTQPIVHCGARYLSDSDHATREEAEQLKHDAEFIETVRLLSESEEAHFSRLEREREELRGLLRAMVKEIEENSILNLHGIAKNEVLDIIRKHLEAMPPPSQERNETMSELKPCPFCGAIPQTYFGKYTRFEDKPMVVCYEPKCPIYFIAFTPEDWNARAPRSQGVGEVKEEIEQMLMRGRTLANGDGTADDNYYQGFVRACEKILSLLSPESKEKKL